MLVALIGFRRSFIVQSLFALDIELKMYLFVSHGPQH